MKAVRITTFESQSGQNGFGVLETEAGRLPLIGLDVDAKITGLASEMTVRQTFRNATEGPLEATYIFPLPDRAAATAFRMKVGERVVEGELKERSKARLEYDRAIEAGHRASIAEEERSGTFTLRVGNIPAKENVSVELTLVGDVPVSGGEATFRFPLVVAPRYVPGVPLDGPSVGEGWASDTDQVPDASRVTPPVLLPGFPNPVQLSISVELDPAGLECSDDFVNQLQTSLPSALSDDGPPWTLRVEPGERLNQDFILRFPVAKESVQTVLAVGPAASGQSAGTWALTLVPPALSEDAVIAPRDVVVVLDRSGSMEGWKMVAARRAVARVIDTLLDDDRLAVLAFDNTVEQPPEYEGLSAATNQTRWRTCEWLGKIEARGGTDMGPALAEAVKLFDAREPNALVSGATTGDAGTAAPEASAYGSQIPCERFQNTLPGRQQIVVLVTDGQIAGEDMLLRELAVYADGASIRIHAIGIDRAVNAGFLRRLADMGGGTCDLVESEDRLDEVMDQVHRTIATPVLTNLALTVVSGEIADESIVPARLPNLFVDHPVTIYGRCNGNAIALRIVARAKDAAGNMWKQDVSPTPASGEALAALWGRAKVRELEDKYAAHTSSDPEALMREIIDVSLATHVLSRFTAYVAVDRSEVVNAGGEQQQIVQPVEPAEGWDMLGKADLSRVFAASSMRMSGGLTLHSLFGAVSSDAYMNESLACRSDAPEPKRKARRADRLQKLSRARRPQSPEPEAANKRRNLVAEIREYVTKLQSDTAWSDEVESRLSKLADLLDRLGQQLRAQVPVTHLSAGFGQHAEELRQLIGVGGGDAAQFPAQLRGLLESITTVIDELDAAPATRDRFWT